MKLFFHYCPHVFSNCYVLGSDFSDDDGPRDAGVSPDTHASRDALIVDPGLMDKEILTFIEKPNYNLRGILITHDHGSHDKGLRTLKRIYDVDIYAINPLILDMRTVSVRDGETVHIGPFTVEVFSVPGHSADSAVYRIENLLFTGDALSAGLVGSTASGYGDTVQMNALRSKIFSLPGEYTVLPGHGPPTSLEAERRFNTGLLDHKEHTARRPALQLYLD